MMVFIVDVFGGALKPEYKTIKYHSVDGEFDYLKIRFTENREKEFYDHDFKKWNCKDIVKFHEIRLDKNSMTRINVKGDWLRKVRFVSNLWQWREGYYYCKYQDYVGPQDEEVAMINEITEFYVSKMKEVKISIQEATQYDLEMYDSDEDF